MPGLEDLRSKITVIPQDPTLFKDSLRFNLDPEGNLSDQTLTQLLKKASLEKLLNRDPQGLDQIIEEGGNNLSSGEKQLICICRAILRKNKVVIIDEATSNIDVKTEQVIQNLINNEFRNSTILTIAHRLNTIMHSDRILVLHKGEISHFCSPQDLPKNVLKGKIDQDKLEKVLG